MGLCGLPLAKVLFLLRVAGLVVLASTAGAAAVLVALRWRRKRAPQGLPWAESVDTFAPVH